MRTLFKKVTRFAVKRTRSGQSLIIIAFAIVALIGFVGIATDVAMMFVRYSTLRRAVDAAAIAAAGQVRKGMDYSKLTAMAQEFIGVHGLDINTLKVETCETEVADYLNRNPQSDDPTPTPPMPLGWSYDGSTGKSTAAQKAIKGLIATGDQLCKTSPQKLVRISAQILSPTTFLSLLGFRTITLQSSAVSQTAELDVAIVLDASLSMAADTDADMKHQQQNPPGTDSPKNAWPIPCTQKSDFNTGDGTWVYCNDSLSLMNFKDFTNREPATIAEAQGGVDCGAACGSHRDPTYVWGLGTMPLIGAGCAVSNTCNFGAQVMSPSGPYDGAAGDPGLRAIPYDGQNGRPSLIQNWPSCPPQYDGAGGNPCDTFDDTYTGGTNGYNNIMKQGGRNFARYDCWYSPNLGSRNAATYGVANYSWAGCCNDPTVQSDSVDPNTRLPVSTFDPWYYNGHNPLGAAVVAQGDYNSDPYWYVYDDETDGFLHSVIMTTGQNQFINKPGGGHPDAAQVMWGGIDRGVNSSNTVVPGTRAAYRGTSTLTDQTDANYANHGVTGDGNYSDLICRPFKDVRDAARRFITRLDFTRGDRVILVTFSSEAKVLTPYGSDLPIITTGAAAIQTLNMQAGVEVNPSHTATLCQTGSTIGPVDWGGQPTPLYQYYINVGIPSNYPDYWAQAQCPDTNTGGGIAAANDALFDPRYIRREAVWVMVLLSDGYPNRTPSVGQEGIGFGALSGGQPQLANLTSIYEGANPGSDSYSGGATNDNPCTGPGHVPGDAIYDNCCNQPSNGIQGANIINPALGLKPAYCARITQFDVADSGWGMKSTDPLNSLYGTIATWQDPVQGSSQPLFSFGFCPNMDILSSVRNTNASANPNTNPNNTPPGNTLKNKFYDLGNAQYSPCVASDPDARHFCMDREGSILPSAPVTPTQCDPLYDPMDYARDRVDFAALNQYTQYAKGNFIAMYSIFFAHQTDNNRLQENVLGIKFMRYVADAGDNGQIDNPIQRWYRDMRDGHNFSGVGPASTGVNPPPTGGYGITSNTTVGSILYTNPPLGIAGQPTLPFYSASNPWWKTNFDYDPSPSGDPCAAFDYFYWNSSGTYAQMNVNGAGDTYLKEIPPGGGTPDSDQFHTQAQSQCGQYYYATQQTLGQAFLSIAGRLFTRLTQ